MEKVATKDSSVRLVIAAGLNALLWLCFIEQNSERYELVFFGGAFAIVTVMLIGRVFWRGAGWQIILATLLAVVPARVMFQTLRLCIRGY